VSGKKHSQNDEYGEAYQEVQNNSYNAPSDGMPAIGGYGVLLNFFTEFAGDIDCKLWARK